jgi:hypothetical protein
LGHQSAQAIVLGRGTSGDDVSHWPAAEGHAHLLTASDRSQRLAQRRLQLTNPDLTHVTTLPAVRPQDEQTAPNAKVHMAVA